MEATCSIQAETTNGSSKNMKARTTEINFEMGTWRKRSLQLQMRLAGSQPRLICKVTDVLGRKELVSLGQVCSWT